MAKSVKHLFHMFFKQKNANCYVALLCVQMWNVQSQLGTYVPLSRVHVPMWKHECAFLIGMYTFPYGCMIVGNLVGKWTNNVQMFPHDPHVFNGNIKSFQFGNVPCVNSFSHNSQQWAHVLVWEFTFLKVGTCFVNATHVPCHSHTYMNVMS
jgi:hypothetical protein